MQKAEKLARTRKVVLAFLAVFLPLIPANWYLASTSFFGRMSDLPEYYAASWLILTGRGADIYVLEQIFAAQQSLFPSMSGRVVPLFMAPPITIFIAPLALVPVEICHYIWCALLVGAIVATVIIIGKLWSFSLEQRLVLWIFLCTFGPVFDAIRIGQVAPFFLLAVSCALYFLVKEPFPRSAPSPSAEVPAPTTDTAVPSSSASAADKEPATIPALAADREAATPTSPRKRTTSTFAAAFCLALLSCKPQILIPLLVALAGAGRYKVLFQTIALIVALVVISLCLIGPSGWMNYLTLLNGCIDDISIMHPDQNPTVRGQLLRIVLDSSQSLSKQIAVEQMHAVQVAVNSVSTACTAVDLLSLGVIFWINRRFRNSENGLLQAAKQDGPLSVLRSDWLLVMVLTMPLGLVCSQYLMTYDVLLLVPALALFGGKKLYARFSPFVIVPAVFLGIVYMQPFYSYIYYGWLLEGSVCNPFFVVLLYFAIMLTAAPFRPTEASKLTSGKS